MRRSLIITDLHFTSSPRDEYRWGIFDEVAKYMRLVDRLLILGDLTEDKDCHEGALVNRIVNSLANLDKDVIILRGNHDGLDPSSPFFKFLSRVPKLEFISAPTRTKIAGRSVLFIPHVRNVPDWRRHLTTQKDTDYVFLHATVKGACSENGQVLDGEITTDDFAQFSEQSRIYSGDVHVPQTVGRVCYIGSPYPIRFGDKFQPRMLYLDQKEDEHWVPLRTIRRVMLDVKDYSEVRKAKLREGDQVKVRVHLPVENLGDWFAQRSAVKAACKDLRIELISVEVVKLEGKGVPMLAKAKAKSSESILETYIKKQRLTDRLAKIGREVLKRC